MKKTNKESRVRGKRGKPSALLNQWQGNATEVYTAVKAAAQIGPKTMGFGGAISVELASVTEGVRGGGNTRGGRAKGDNETAS